ncbi:MAG: hypothetical protein QGI06_10235 [Rhodospirillales bacterium]|jgi:hypothetical protein|nr:hypothetical protein [Rhodospirillales bacterium]|tara:strand:- start:182 stop:352 length:171 start_codon:yes stop_codon:yes gene_type:complete
MPNYLKFTISVIVCAVAAVAFHLGVKGGWVVLGLAVGMVFAIWLFPEAKKREANGG